VAVLGDTHNPFQDQRVIREVELFLHELQPDLVIYPGDMWDFYGISNFDKNPNRAGRLQQDLNSTAELFKRQRVLLPNARMIMEEGNHEDRLRRFLWSKATALESLDCLTVESLYKLKDSEVEHVDYEEGVLINGNFLITHGSIIRKFSAYTAHGMMDKHGKSGIHGHSHRGGASYHTDRYGEYAWYENFCLCDLNPDWISHPDWQHGFSLVHFIGDRFWCEQIPIVNRKFLYGGVLYGSGGKKRELPDD